MGQNIGTGGRAWGRILGRCVEYTGVDAIYVIYVIFVIYDINGMPYVMDEYVNMGVKRTVRISGFQPDVI